MDLEAENEGGIYLPGRVWHKPVEGDEEQVCEGCTEERSVQSCTRCTVHVAHTRTANTAPGPFEKTRAGQGRQDARVNTSLYDSVIMSTKDIPRSTLLVLY